MAYADARAWLEQHRNADGSWGYLPGGPGMPEPTVLAIAAGLDPALAWLGDHRDHWAATLLPALLWELRVARDLCTAIVDRLLTTRGVTIELDREIVDHDGTIPGWGWVPDTAPWVEPTAYALLSLVRAGHEGHERVAQGRAMILDRQCTDGGWNYGNVEVFGTALGSFPAPTGWAVLALPPSPAVNRGLEALLNALETPSVLSLSMAILGRAAHAAPLFDLPDALRQRQAADGSFEGRADRTAIAAAALRAVEEGHVVFRHAA